jgi:hypothetical protein
MNFRLLTPITEIQIIAKGSSVDVRHELNRVYGRANWRKLKGVATVEYENGQIWVVELHWFEASNIGQKRMKDKYKLIRIT